MPYLYIVNCTAQTMGINYRLDFAIDGNGNRMDGRNLQHLHQPIAAGTQVRLGRELFPDQIEGIIQQLEHCFGAAHVNDVRTAKNRGVVRLIYSIDKPVARPICEDVKAHNMGVLTDLGTRRRERLAISADYNLREIGQDTGNFVPPNLEMEVESVGEADPEMTAPPITERIKVTGNAPEPRRGRGRPRKAA